MKLTIIILTILCLNITSANDSTFTEMTLEEFCQDDPTGEIYSELTDAADLETQFEILGLDAELYQEQYDEFNYSIYNFADGLNEVGSALNQWEEDTCNDRGLDMFLDYQI